uniref:Uncharacterized protein n=1 Tax=viral metagenome TaxID=1070528 RepID=A0A6M3Y0J3_9ZZZZ
MACEKCKKRKELEDKFLKHLEENVQKVFEDPKWKQDVLKANPDGMGRCSGVGDWWDCNCQGYQTVDDFDAEIRSRDETERRQKGI